jgi:AraC-like DNA-binding protein
MIVESEEDMVNRILPDTAIVMAFRFKGNVDITQENNKILLSAQTLTGLSKYARLIHYEEQSGNILVRFRQGGAAAFVKQPVHELFNTHTPLDNFFSSSELELISEQIDAATTIEAKVEVIASFLQSKLIPQKPDLLVERAIHQIKASGGILKIKQLAASLYISHDAFEKRFRKAVGSSPKQYAATVRMRALVNQGFVTEPLTELALNAGFFDQSHFIKEFKRFTGQTPSDFFSGSSFF